MSESIALDKIKNSDTSQEVIDVYKRVKSCLEDGDRKDWSRIRKRCWDAAYPLDPDQGDNIWTGKEREAMIMKGMIPIAVNDLAKDIQAASALITSKAPGLNFIPIGSGDLYIAELFKRGWDFVINGNEGQVTLYDLVKEKNIGNLAVLEAHHDPSMGIFGKILIEDRDPTTYYFDKKSKKRDHSDVSFGKAHLITKDYALEIYEGLTEEDLIFSELQQDAEGGNVPDGMPGQDAYAVDTKDKPQGPDSEEEENVWEIEDWELKKEKEIWVMIPDATQTYGYIRKTFKTYEDVKKDGWILSPNKATAIDAMGVNALVWPRLVTKRIQRIIVGKKLISKTINPLGIDAEGAPVLSIITLQEDKTLSGYPTGKTARALELTRSRNKRRMQSIYIASKNADATKVLPQGCKWVKDEVHGDYIEMSKDASMAPSQMGPVNSSAEMINLEQIDKQDIHDEYQINDIIQGKIQTGQSNMAHRTVLSLTEMVGVISSPGVLAFESSLVKLGKAVASLMIMVWPRVMWKRLIEDDEMGTWMPDRDKIDPQTGQPVAPEPSVINRKWDEALTMLSGETADGQMIPEDKRASLIDIDVKIVAGSTQPTNRMAKAGMAMEMVKAGLYPPEIALKYLDDPLKDEAIDMLDRKRKEELDAIRQGQSVKGQGK